MKRIYFAGPLFCEAELIFNKTLAEIFEKWGFSVFLPQRDGVLAAELENKSEEEKVEIVFKKDTSEIKKADALFMVLDGRVPDEGACAELGMAYALGKRCFGMKTDARALEEGLDINPLLSGCFEKIFKNSDMNALIKEIENYLKSNPL